MSGSRPRPGREREPAPLFSDGMSLCAWLHGRLGERGDELSRAVCRTALDLLAHVVLALKGHDRDAHIAGADEALVMVRVLLQLAATADVLTQEQALHALDIADRIGRQLGGWRRSLGADGTTRAPRAVDTGTADDSRERDHTRA